MKETILGEIYFTIIGIKSLQIDMLCSLLAERQEEKEREGALKLILAITMTKLEEGKETAKKKP